MPLWRGRRPDLGPVSRDSAEDPASAGSSHFPRSFVAQGAADAAGEGAGDPPGASEAAGPPPVMGAHGSTAQEANPSTGEAPGPGEDGMTAMAPTRSGTHVSWLRSGEPWAANVMTAHTVAPQLP